MKKSVHWVNPFYEIDGTSTSQGIMGISMHIASRNEKGIKLRPEWTDKEMEDTYRNMRKYLKNPQKKGASTTPH